jgi:hypothetical protein
LVDRVTNAKVNKIVTIKEGQGIIEQKDFRIVSPAAGR